jgi:hypothetical protein
VSDINEFQMCSGIGQFHTNEPAPKIPPKTLTEYLTIDIDGIRALVDNPKSVSKKQSQWFIPSTHMSRSFISQEQHGEYLALTVDLDKQPPSVKELAEVIKRMIGCVNYEIYNTSSATKENQKSRLIIWLDKSLGFDDWSLCQKILNDRFDEFEIIADRALERSAQLVYLPNRGAFYETEVKRNGRNFDPFYVWADEIAVEKDSLQVQQIELDNAKAKSLQKRAAMTLNSAPDLIGAFNLAYTVQEILVRSGYTQRGNSFRHPNSESGSYSASVRIDGNGICRVNALSPSDPLYVEGSNSGHDAFSVFEVLYHG